MKVDVVEAELNRAIQLLGSVDRNITIFGSARVELDDPMAKQAYQLGKSLSDAGFNILTGAGPGIMQAANQGAFEGKSQSIGLNIQLPKEQTPNDFLDQCISFEHFFTRKVVLIKYACACVFFPGGFGTADELFEVLTLVQTRKGQAMKIFLVGREYWTPLVAWFDQQLADRGYISAQDLASFEIVDGADQIIKRIGDIACH